MNRSGLRDLAILIVCALILIAACFIIHACASHETEKPEQLQLDVPLDDGMSEETVVYDMNSEVE